MHTEYHLPKLAAVFTKIYTKTNISQMKNNTCYTTS